MNSMINRFRVRPFISLMYCSMGSKGGVLIEFFAILTFFEIMDYGLRVDGLLFLSRPVLLLKFLFLFFRAFEAHLNVKHGKVYTKGWRKKYERWILRIRNTKNPSVLLLKIYALF